MELSGAQLHMLESDLETGQAITLLTPDSERTFATYLGAAVELRADELDATMFEPYQMLHLEGYLVHNEPLILRALDIAARLGMEVSLDLASYNVVEAHLSFLHHITAAYVDILFANEAEALAFTGKQPAEALLDRQVIVRRYL
jgi:sugar/nucleoside kinase (ribokinase family)